MVDLINKSPHVVALAWSLGKDKTLNKLGLRDFELHSTVQSFLIQGSNETHSFYVYRRVAK
jgi:hypothetical protein